MDDNDSSAGEGRLHAEANYSPSRTPPLFQSISGNDSSSGSPGGSRRHGSTGDKDRRSREERVKLMKERHEQEHERRLAELRAAQEKEIRTRQAHEAERVRRIQELKVREMQRRHAVEERRRRLETEDKEKREQIIAKYKEFEQKQASQRDNKKPVYAFGSSTPRTLAYLEHLDTTMRIYNARLVAGAGAGPAAEEDSSQGGKRGSSAGSLSRRPLTASSSPNLSPLHQPPLCHTRTKPPLGTSYSSRQHRAQNVGVTTTSTASTKNTTLSHSGRWGGSMVASMHGGSAAAAAHAHHNDPLANAHSMTMSFAVGETAGAPIVKNVRVKGPINTATTTRSQSTTRLARSTVATRKVQENDNQHTARSTPKRRPHISEESQHGDGAPASKAKGVSSSRTPSAPPPIVRRPLTSDSASRVTAPASSKSHQQNGKATSPKTTPAASAPRTLPTAAVAPKRAQIDHSPQPKSESSKSVGRKPTTPQAITPDRSAVSSPVQHVETTQSFSPSPDDMSASVIGFAFDKDPTNELVVQTVDSHILKYENDDTLSEYRSPKLSPNRFDAPFTVDNENGTPTMERNEMTGSTTELITNVPKPTGQGVGKVLSKEEATAALAERRRLAREQLEREKELERQREEQQRLQEEEERRREEEEFRRQEAEELRLLEEQRRLEEERIRKLMEDEQKKREEEGKRREDEARKKVEAETRAREESEKVERERKDAEEKFKREEVERLERKRRLDSIMQRTRQSGGMTSVSSTPSRMDAQNAASAASVNGNDGSFNNSVYMTPDAYESRTTASNNTDDTPSIRTSTSSSVLKKIAHVRPEVGRSLENILNRVKSTPNVNADQTEPSSAMVASLSADKMNTPNGGGDTDPRMTQSMYVTPGNDLTGVDYEDDEPTSSILKDANSGDINANRSANGGEARGNLTSLLDFGAASAEDDKATTPRGWPMDHNDNTRHATNGHRETVARTSATDSSPASAVTIIHQKTSPSNDISLADPFGSPSKYDDLINDNFKSMTSSGSVQNTTTSRQDRSLLDF